MKFTINSLKPVILGLLMIAAQFSSGQKIRSKNVPESARNTFEKTFNGATKVHWVKEGSNFEAEFELQEKETSAVFDSNGKLLETETEIFTAELPSPVTTYMQNNYAGKKIREVSSIRDSEGNITYEVEIKGNELFFDKSGKFIRKER